MNLSLGVVIAALALEGAGFAQTSTGLADAEAYQYSGPMAGGGSMASSSQSQGGPMQAVVKLVDPPLVAVAGVNAKQNGSTMSADQQRAYLAQLKQKQDTVMAQVSALGGTELGRVSIGHNAIFISIDRSQIQGVQNISGVAALRPARQYQVSLAETLPYVGATAVQNTGLTGQGIRVAMLDTGIDYTHYNLGGSGNVADYAIASADPTAKPPANLFPTSKVIGGYDFVGDVWPKGAGGVNGPLSPDPNPIDLIGHGSHTADIVGGRSNDGLHVGVAPGTQLYAVKVCSSVANSCPGLALLEGVDFALDPNGTGTVNDAVDVISMSIGGSFGQREDDLSEAFTDVVNFGVVSVISAGNDGNIPYVVGFPASTPEVLALAATAGTTATDVPLVINSPASIAGTYPNTATLDFAPITAPVTGNVVYVGQGCPASGTTPADPYPSGDLSGKIFLIDRGACAVSLKIDRAAQAGAIGVLIGLVAPGDAIPFSNGGGTHFVPSLVIIQSYSTLIKNALTSSKVNATLSLANAIPLEGSQASYSSRGPNYSYNMLKPDMSAPGTVSAAQPGTGNGETTESGTSFACPLAAGSAALLLSKNRSFTPGEIKALLMENSEPNVTVNPALSPGALSPMSRADAGELRVDRSAGASTAAWDASAPLAVSLSFGTYRLNANQTFKKKIVVRNYSSSPQTYNISNTYRDAPNNTGVTLNFASNVSVPANGYASFIVTAAVNATALPTWTLNGGPNGGNGSLLNTVEYAGYLTLSGGGDNVHLPWHILPHKAANVQPASDTIALDGNPVVLPITNSGGAADGLVDVFSLTGTGTQFPPSAQPAPGSNHAVINLRAAGVRLACTNTACTAFAVQFAVSTFGQRSHPDVPAEFDVFIDVDGDGVADLDVFNADIGFAMTGTTFSGQNGVFIADLAANTFSGPYYYSIADLDSANVILTAPLSALNTAAGLQVTVDAPFSFTVGAFDNYFTGNLTDLIGPMTYELDMPQSYALSEFTVPANGTVNLQVYPNNAAYPYFTGPYNGNSPSQSGLLLMYTDGKAGQETNNVSVNLVSAAASVGR